MRALNEAHLKSSFFEKNEEDTELAL